MYDMKEYIRNWWQDKWYAEYCFFSVHMNYIDDKKNINVNIYWGLGY